VALAQRGFYAFDWRDIHRTTQDAVGMYELIAAPTTPIELDQLPVSIGQVAWPVTFATATFNGKVILDVLAHAECRCSTQG
jgi:hypothetical protein